MRYIHIYTSLSLRAKKATGQQTITTCDSDQRWIITFYRLQTKTLIYLDSKYQLVPPPEYFAKTIK